MKRLIALVLFSFSSIANAAEIVSVECRSEDGVVVRMVFDSNRVQVFPTSEKVATAGFMFDGGVREQKLILLLQDYNGNPNGAKVEIFRSTGQGYTLPPNTFDASGLTPTHQCLKADLAMQPPKIRPVEGGVRIKCDSDGQQYGFEFLRGPSTATISIGENATPAGRIVTFHDDRITLCKGPRCTQGRDLFNLITGYHFNLDTGQPRLMGKCEQDTSPPVQKRF